MLPITIFGTGALSKSEVDSTADIDTATHVIINGFSSITGNAFTNRSNLTNIDMTDTVVAIGESAFEDCTRLEEINMSNNLTNIAFIAFKNCTSLLSVTIPDKVTSIGAYAFERCTRLTTVDIKGAASILQGAFNFCNKLDKITMPNVKSIAIEAFQGCSSLPSFIIPSNVTSISKSTFTDCTSLKSVTIPTQVTSIGESAFQSCAILTSITILGPASIGKNAFSYCTRLSSVNIPNVTNIDVYSFGKCDELTSIYIPRSVTSISDNAFTDSGLLNVNLCKNNQFEITDIPRYNYHFFGKNDTTVRELDHPPPIIITVEFSNNLRNTNSLVTITGISFISPTLFFAGTNVQNIEVINSETIRCKLPQANSGAIEVTTAYGAFTFADNVYTVKPPPTITTVTFASRRNPDSLVTIIGTGFATETLKSVFFAGTNVSNLEVIGSETIRCKLPVNSGVIEVTTEYGTAESSPYTVQLPPAITTVNFTFAYGISTIASLVTITGTGFVSGTSLYFAGTNVPNISFIDSNTITCYLPANTGVIEVSTIHGTFKTPISYTVNRVNNLQAMASMFTNNALVYYKKGSLAPGGVGSVRNSSVKSRKT